MKYDLVCHLIDFVVFPFSNMWNFNQILLPVHVRTHDSSMTIHTIIFNIMSDNKINDVVSTAIVVSMVTLSYHAKKVEGGIQWAEVQLVIT